MAIRDFIVHEVGDQLYRKLTQPASGGKAGDPGLVGTRPCVLLTDQETEGPNTGYATCKFNGSFRFTVHGVTAGGNSAVALGDQLYYDPAPGATNPNINKDVTNGVPFGDAAGVVASAAKTVIVVDLRG